MPNARRLLVTGARWRDTALLLPADLKGLRWQNLLVPGTESSGEPVPVARLLANFPCALLSAG